MRWQWILKIAKIIFRKKIRKVFIKQIVSRLGLLLAITPTQIYQETTISAIIIMSLLSQKIIIWFIIAIMEDSITRKMRHIVWWARMIMKERRRKLIWWITKIFRLVILAIQFSFIQMQIFNRQWWWGGRLRRIRRRQRLRRQNWCWDAIPQTCQSILIVRLVRLLLITVLRKVVYRGIFHQFFKGMVEAALLPLGVRTHLNFMISMIGKLILACSLAFLDSNNKNPKIMYNNHSINNTLSRPHLWNHHQISNSMALINKNVFGIIWHQMKLMRHQVWGKNK